MVNNLPTNKHTSSKGLKLLEVLLWEYSCPSSDKDYYDGSWTMSQMSSFKLTYMVIEQSAQKESLCKCVSEELRLEPIRENPVHLLEMCRAIKMN